MIENPYSNLPDFAFWRRVMAGRSACDVDPVTPPPFTIGPHDQVATAGSCFAQHISRTLVDLGFSYLIVEKPPLGAEAQDNYGVFPARFGNVYTARQLLQMFRRAYGLFQPVDVMWRRESGRWIDPFRPRIQASGFYTPADLLRDRESHLAAVRRMFETCDVFIFTLGLTEAWISTRDRAVFPLAPGLVAPVDSALYTFHNFTVAEVEADLLSFLDCLRTVNPAVRVVLTISPVPLLATYEMRHVLVSSTYSKSVLRVAAETAVGRRAGVAYFPSYEIITGPHSRGSFYEDDLRVVRPEVVAYVMTLFTRHYLAAQSARDNPELPSNAAPLGYAEELALIRDTEAVICDEEAIDSGQ